MKKLLSIILVLCFSIAIFAAAIPNVGAATYDEKYFRAPAAAVYESFGKQGYAYGRITVSAESWVNNNPDGCPVDAVVYWGNANGKLEGYSPAATFKLSTRSTAFEFSDLQIIPEGADRFVVYTMIHGTEIMSTKYVEAMLPEGAAYSIDKAPLMRLVVISDTHLRSSDTSATNIKFKDMLNDVNTMYPDAKGIFINGDVINSGRDLTDTLVPRAEWAKLTEYAQTSKIPIFMGIGNHDIWPNASRDTMKVIFTNTAILPDGSHPNSVHYDFELDGYHFVFIGDDDGDPTYATLSDATLEWLDQTLAKGYSEDKPTFIFFHQALTNTVAGSLTNFGQEWDGVINAVEVRAVLSKYPQAILFSSHSHYSMDNIQNAYSGGNTFPFNFNTASLGSVDGASDEAQGYIVEVYDDAVVLKGRDFAGDEWKGTAQYAVSYADIENNGGTVPAPIVPDNNNNENNDTENNNSNNTQKPTEATPTDDQVEDGEAEPAGCGSALGIGAIVLAVIPGAICFIRRKED